MLNPIPDKNQGGKKVLLSDPQIEAISHGDGPMLIAAGAGSGKTRTLTQRLIHLIENGIKPEKIIAITFTNKAADEMKSRILHANKLKHSEKKPFIGTFHSFGASIIRKEARLLGRASNFVIFDSNDSLKLIRKILKSFQLPDKKYSPKSLQRDISQIKNRLTDPDDAEEVIRTIYREYESELQRFNAFDFDDLLEKVVRLFNNNQLVLKKYQRRYLYILVDEYQDINTCQYALIKLLANEHKNINVVGDDQQSIYGFRWSDFTNFLNFEKDWPEAKIIKLGENYRSTKNIVQAAAAVIENNKNQRDKVLWTENDSGDPIYVRGATSAEEEADIVVSEILKNHIPNGETAILYRTNAQSRAMEQSLNFNSISYKIFGGVKFYERMEIKDVMAGLRYAMNPKDEISKERIIKTFRKKIRESLIENLPEMAEKLNILELIGFFLKTTDYFDHLRAKFKNSEERIENVSELIEFAGSFDSLQEFIERVSLLQATDTIKERLEEKVVRLMTIHLAKGLEFDEVFIIGANEGLLPHQRSLSSNKEVEEERRLAYVAMTRAKKRLNISFYDFASRFLHEIPPELIEVRAPETMWGETTIYLD